MNNDREIPIFVGRGRGSRLFLAAFLIAAGTLLFLSNLGVLPIRNVWEFWPVIVIAFGFARIIKGPDLALRLFGLLLTAVGTVFLLVNLDVIHVRTNDDSWYISVLLIALGIMLLFRVLTPGESPSRSWADFRSFQIKKPEGYGYFTVLGSIKRRADDCADFREGGFLSVLGSIDLDLRRLRVPDPPQTVQLEVSAILGAANVRVPDNWRVQVRGIGIMGTYEDKIVPPNLGSDAPTLVITGHSIMGNIEIEN